MPAVLRMSVDERRARLGVRHRLAAGARVDDTVAIADSVVALHGTDPASVFLSAAARMATPSVGLLEKALYDDRLLVRTLCMRRTMFVLAIELVPVVQAACTDALVPAQRKRTVGMLRDAGVDAPDRHLEELEAATLAAIEAAGEATGAELGKRVPGLARQLVYGAGTRSETTIGMTTRVLFLLSCEQKVVRGRPKGGWTSSAYRWSPMSAWLPASLPRPAAADARVELCRRWLRAFGPATITDIKWWSGLTLGQVRTALSALDVEAVDLDGEPGLVLADDVEPTPAPAPWVALLPALDPTTMGWKQRDWYLGGYGKALFDTNGNAGPTVWSDGRIIGGWAQRKDTGEVVFRLLEDAGAEVAAAVQAEAARLTEWLGDVRVTPRFPTPLQRQLAA
jgi:hypothetical protein